MVNFYFSADWHVGHDNIIKYSRRPFSNVDEMDHALITRHNEVVTNNDVHVHVGDFTLKNRDYATSIIKQLNGQQVFIIGSHYKWLNDKGKQIWEKTIDNQKIVCCHYPMYSWPESHYGSWLLHGHHHGRLEVQCKAIDVGVDTNNFYPYSFEQIKSIMESKPVTPGTITKKY
jgi:calcineurin-like phosphoesterase family protein